ncbi:MAG: AMP-dependent synthetase [Deltaproteobacteria bacterium]|nr:MAG: AMP-dependent synthetase [Deltaproteobacteria bacterium]
MLEGLWTRIDRARILARALRSTGSVEIIRPGQLVEFLRGAIRVAPGPHLSVMYHAAAHPDREALVEYTGDGVRRMTWGELDATINRLANALFARGVVGGSPVALMLPNGGEYLIAYQALARLGATAVQIGYRLKPAEIAHILDNAQPRATLVHAEYLAAMTAARAQVGTAGPMIVVGDAHGEPATRGPELAEWDRALAAASPHAPPRSRGGGGDGGGVIVYTSGTTGKSKGAHRNLKTTGLESVADLLVQVGVRANDRHLVVCPLYHSAAPAFVAIMMSLGATIILMSHFDAAGALDIIERERVTCSFMVPTMLVRLTSLPADVLASRDTSSLRWVMSGAAPLPTEAARRFMDRFGPILWNFYGATETGMVTLAGPADHVSRPGTIGRPLFGNEIRLLDDAGHPSGLGEVGELYARNSMLITGYHRNAEATRASQRDGFFSVGDLARRDTDGYYYLESRKHDMVISGGVNIYPREIEDHLHTHPAILDAAVIGVPDPEWGESLRAFVVVRDGHALAEQDVIEYCRAGLADFKRPRKVTFLPELPCNPTGKVLKRELREHG